MTDADDLKASLSLLVVDEIIGAESKVTPMLRWIERSGARVLQQKWMVCDIYRHRINVEFREEWRDVPITDATD